jgi:[acyl-carrier-protein] S-malonyltransferase
VFPGQGSQRSRMGRPWTGHPSWELVGDASDVTGRDLAYLLLDAGDQELTETRNAQLAAITLGLVILDAVERIGIEPTVCAGHSLGEYTALVAAGVLAREDGARLVAARGAAMRDAAATTAGGLVALIGGTLENAEAACAAIDGLFLANLNGPGQIVVGGDHDALDALGSRARELGFRRAIPLRVGGAFHTPLMAPAAAALGPWLAAAPFTNGHAQVVANVDGATHDEPADWPPLLLRQLTEPVRFDACVASLPAGAVVVECGPGRVLQGLIRRIRDDLDLRSVGEPSDLALLAGLT